MSGAPADLVRRLDAEGARHVYVDGGKTIQGFLNAGLINEMIITFVPVLIGGGIPLFGKLDRDIKLQHIETILYRNSLLAKQVPGRKCSVISPPPLPKTPCFR